MRLILLLTMFLFTGSMQAAVTDADKELLDNHLEFLLNPGFENGRAQWTASGGTTALVTSGGNLLSGKNSVTWDSSSASQTLCSSLRTISEGAKGRPGIGSIVMEVPSGTSTHTLEVRDGSANILATSGSRSYAGGSNNSQRINTGIFSYPSSGTIRLCLVSVASDEPLVALDLATLRTEPWQLVSLQGASLVASGVYPNTANCTWDNTTTGSFVAFTADADCPAPTLITNDGPGILSTVDADLPQFTINNLPAGSCEVQFQGNVGNGTSGVNNSLAISDGTNTRNAYTSSQGATGGNVTMFSARAPFTYTSAGNRTFSLFGRTSGGTMSVGIGTGFTSASPTLSFSIWCSPLQANQAFRADQVGWKVDANISGGYPALSSSSVSTYTGLEDGSLSMTQNAGSAPVQIGCSSTNAPSGLTCSAGSESVSVAFTPPVAGDYLACASFNHYAELSGSGNVQATFQVVETATNAQTVIQEGKSRVASGNSNASFVLHPHRVCGNFTFTSVSQKMLRLMYEQTTSATVVSNSILADAAASNGQRDIHWEVYPVNPWIQAPLITGSLGQQQVYVSTPNGYGSTATRIRRFSTVEINAGSSITYADSASNGASFTINVPGVYSITYADNSASAFNLGISVNSSALTTSIDTLTFAQGKRAQATGAAGVPNTIEVTLYLNAGDIVRPQTDGVPDATAARHFFNITRVN